MKLTIHEVAQVVGAKNDISIFEDTKLEKAEFDSRLIAAGDLFVPLKGAFYLFPNVTKAMEMKGYTDVTDFTTAILEEAEVALVTGAGFGAPENVRLSYATDLDTLKEAVKRLKAFMEK